MSFTRNSCLRALALSVGLVLLCNSTESPTGRADAQEFGLVGSSNREVEFVPMPDNGGYLASDQAATRFRRQVTIPQGGYQQPQQQPAGGIMSYLSELGPQLAQASAINTLLNPPQQQQQQSPFLGGGGGGTGSPSSSVNPVMLIGQLSELIRSTQERSARGVESAQANAQSALQSAGQQSSDLAKSVQNGFQSTAQTAGQQTAEVAKSAQSGLQSALSEIGAGLQRIATNNPNLVPDVKNLYQSVSSKLSPSQTPSVGQVANSS